MYLGRGGHGTCHFHLGVHDLGLRGHGGDLGADGVRSVFLLPELHQLLGQDFTRLLVTALCHFLDLGLLQRGNVEVSEI